MRTMDPRRSERADPIEQIETSLRAGELVRHPSDCFASTDQAITRTEWLRRHDLTHGPQTQEATP